MLINYYYISKFNHVAGRKAGNWK